MAPLLLALLVACDHPPPKVVTVVCEDTGHDPTAGCTHDFLSHYLRQRLVELRYLPGSAFVVVATAGTYGDADVTVVATVPPTFGEDGARAEKVWLDEADAVIASLAIADDATDPKRNKSDLLGGVSRAATEANNYVGFEHELVVASDGLFRSVGLAIESDAVTPDGVLHAVEQSRLPWDLSGFSTITMCGWHGVGATPDQVTRRKEVWTALVEAGQGPTPAVKTTCEALLSPVLP